MKTSRKLWLAGALATTLAVAGCWGNNDDNPVTPAVTEVPDSAGASVAAFIALAATAAMTVVGTSIRGLFTTVSTQLGLASTAAGGS